MKKVWLLVYHSVGARPPRIRVYREERPPSTDSIAQFLTDECFIATHRARAMAMEVSACSKTISREYEFCYLQQEDLR